MREAIRWVRLSDAIRRNQTPSSHRCFHRCSHLSSPHLSCPHHRSWTLGPQSPRSEGASPSSV